MQNRLIMMVANITHVPRHYENISVQYEAISKSGKKLFLDVKM